MTRSDIWKLRPCVVLYREMKDDIRRAAGELPLNVGFVFIKAHCTMPASWSKKKKLEMEGQNHRVRPDSDNIAKGVIDAMLAEDGCVFAHFAHKVWCSEGNARYEISVFA